MTRGASDTGKAGLSRPVAPTPSTRAGEQTTLHAVIVESSRAALALQDEHGAFPAGWNGPYHDIETPVRNTAHWVITLLRAHQISGDDAFLSAARRGLEYLTSRDVRPMNATFFCRTNPEKDFSNRLMGQAWAIEALCVAADYLHEPAYRELAREVFLLHPFVHKAGLWRCVHVDGSFFDFDRTFNHQLLFAAAGALIDNDPESEIGKRITRHLDRVKSFHLRVDAETGRIVHNILAITPPSSPQARVRRTIEGVLSQGNKPPKAYQAMKEAGYHAFNMYGFAILKERFPQHPIWESKAFRAALAYVNTEGYVQALEGNKYGFPYNPPGFEVALTQQVFADTFGTPIRTPEWWVSQQLQRHYNGDTRLLNRDTADEATMAARLYEAAKLRDLDVTL